MYEVSSIARRQNLGTTDTHTKCSIQFIKSLHLFRIELLPSLNQVLLFPDNTRSHLSHDATVGCVLRPVCHRNNPTLDITEQASILPSRSQMSWYLRQTREFSYVSDALCESLTAGKSDTSNLWKRIEGLPQRSFARD